MKVNLPDGESNGVRIERFEVSSEDVVMANLRLMRDGHRHRLICPGTYTRLVMNGGTMMSDTPAEQADHRWFVKNATGRVLVTGLGIGMVAMALAAKPDVVSVTVLENDPDVIGLVAPHMDPKITVIEADAHKHRFPRGTTFDAVWNDIWQHISLDDAESRATLSRKYFRLCTTDIKGNWADPEFREQQRLERQQYGGWRY